MDGVGFDALDSQTTGEEFVGGVRTWGMSKVNDATPRLPKAQRSKRAEYIKRTLDDRKPPRKREQTGSGYRKMVA